MKVQHSYCGRAVLGTYAKKEGERLVKGSLAKHRQVMRQDPSAADGRSCCDQAVLKRDQDHRVLVTGQSCGQAAAEQTTTSVLKKCLS